MKRITLGELCHPNVRQLKANEETMIDYIDIASVDNVSKKIKGFQTMPFGEAPSRARKPVQNGSILVSTVRPNLNAVAILEEGTPNISVASTGFCILDCKDSTDKRFVFNFCNSKRFVNDMVSQATGASYPAVNDKIVRNSLVPAYSYEEQCRIGQILDKVSTLIETRTQELKSLDDLIKARFVEMFGEDIKQSNMTIADIAEETTVGIANSATHAYSESGVVMLRNQNIRVNYLDDRDLIYIKQDFAEKYKNKALHEGDILVTRTGANVGMACIVPKKYEGCQTFTTLILRLRKDISISPIFVCHYINSPLGKSFVDENKIGGGQPNFGAKQLSIMPIVVPSEEKQIAFDLFVNQVDKSKHHFSSSSLFSGF
ncbi:MAG: restriction endonuclease subunit S [Clostridia bacterium]